MAYEKNNAKSNHVLSADPIQSNEFWRAQELLYARRMRSAIGR